jgi:putative sigma-54 modulation protein
MKVNIQAVNFNIDKKLVNFTEEQVVKLEKYYDKIISADVFLKVEQTSEKENKLVELNIHVPGDSFIVKKNCKTFEEAVDLSCESQERLIKKRKEKLNSLH